MTCAASPLRPNKDAHATLRSPCDDGIAQVGTSPASTRRSHRLVGKSHPPFAPCPFDNRSQYTENPELEYELRDSGGWGGEASPRSPFSRWLWRLSRHNQWEVKDSGGSQTLQTSRRGGDRINRVINRSSPLISPARPIRRVALVALIHRHPPEVARLDHDVLIAQRTIQHAREHPRVDILGLAIARQPPL